MIRLTRKDGVEILLNTEKIKRIEEGPCTRIILIDGEVLLVKNSLFDISTKIKAAEAGKKEEQRILAVALAEARKAAREMIQEEEQNSVKD